MRNAVFPPPAAGSSAGVPPGCVLSAAGDAHRTISDFRAFHLKELGELFVQVVRLAREMGLVKLGTIAVDGTKVRANASRASFKTASKLARIEAAVEQRLAALKEEIEKDPKASSQRTGGAGASGPRCEGARRPGAGSAR